MKLYHGTRGSLIPTILTEGISPRSNTGTPSNWDIESREDLVYLTKVYSGFFASAACDEDDDESWGIIEIDTDKIDENNLLPDEDFVEQASRNPSGAGPFNELIEGKTLEEATKFFRDNLDTWKEFWSISLDGIGNCAHIGIVPAESITRTALYDPRSNQEMTWDWDPTISILNFHICRDKYTELTNELFDINNSYVVTHNTGEQ